MRVRVASYNIHRAIGLDRRFRPQRVQTILADHAPDLVLLQEVDEGAPRSRELNLAREIAGALDLPHFALGHNVSLRKGRYGNATLSRWPILRERNIDLTIGRRKRRGCQHTTIDLGASGRHPLEVFNLHLGLSARERRQQMGLLVSSKEFVELDQESPVIVGGDFNDWRSELRPLLVDALAFGCATDRPTARGPRAIRTYPAFSPRGGLDRLYFRGGLELRSVMRCRHRAARLASDHLPVFAEFQWTARDRSRREEES